MCIRIFKKLCCCCCRCCGCCTDDKKQKNLEKKHAYHGGPRPVAANDYYRRQGYKYNYGSAPYKASHKKGKKAKYNGKNKHYKHWGDIDPVVDDSSGGSCWDCTGGGDGGGGDGGGGGGDGGGGGGGGGE